jgi:hypothetical protein
VSSPITRLAQAPLNPTRTAINLSSGPYNRQSDTTQHQQQHNYTSSSNQRSIIINDDDPRLLPSLLRRHLRGRRQHCAGTLLFQSDAAAHPPRNLLPGYVVGNVSTRNGTATGTSVHDYYLCGQPTSGAGTGGRRAIPDLQCYDVHIPRSGSGESDLVYDQCDTTGPRQGRSNLTRSVASAALQIRNRPYWREGRPHCARSSRAFGGSLRSPPSILMFPTDSPQTGNRTGRNPRDPTSRSFNGRVLLRGRGTRPPLRGDGRPGSASPVRTRHKA